MKVTFKHRGNFNKTENFLEKAKKTDFFTILEKYGEAGVAALASATPVDTGLTASSWSYEIHQDSDDCAIYWTNSNVNNYVNIAIILQYGHGTRNGGYVQGRDYINPAIRPIFDEIAEAAWREVQSW
jgi:hypothetical protein